MKKGFTLAEVLITLGIVGVVAVLTVPSVMKNYQNRMYVAQLQKVYSQLSDATQSIMNDEHVDNFYETSAARKNVCTTDEETSKTTCTTDGTQYFLTTYFKTIKKDCAKGDYKCTAGSSSSSYKNISGRNVGGIGEGVYCIQTVNGATICATHNSSNSVTSVFVDVNGPAEPNTAGRDVFSMDIKKDGSISDCGTGSNDPEVKTPLTCNSSTSDVFGAAGGCLTTIMNSGWKMEY
jgi:prepilin-type N-terminal cleavage/methylation domain-containing protein